MVLNIKLGRALVIDEFKSSYLQLRLASTS